MGQVTDNLQVWTPDSDDLNEPDVYLAAMAASLETGVGERILLQEKAIGLKASVGHSAWGIPPITPGVIPYAVTANGDFNEGLTFSAGTATVEVPGMYLVCATVGTIGGTTGKGLKVQIYWKGNVIVTTEAAQTDGIWGSVPVTVVVNCKKGDTIQARSAITGIGALATSNNGESTHISIAMVQAVPS